jgi:hypothetical protein
VESLFERWKWSWTQKKKRNTKIFNMGFHALVNTRLFSEAAVEWVKNGGRYTRAPQGSREYYQYWDEQQKRCLYGYKCGDLWIPGRYYGYLNFSPMSRVPESTIEANRDRKGKLSQRTAEKVVAFPSFWEIDYEWWNFKHIAWYGGTFMDVTSPGGEHLVALKTRGAGFSYKESWDGVYNYNFIHGSKSYYFASTEPYLIGDAIMDKVKAGLDWINEYCPPWKKNRQVNDTLFHMKASYKDDYQKERGVMSEIIAQIVDKPDKTRGKRGRKITMEEGGSFPNLEKAVEISLGSLREGSLYVGQMSIFGTGGEKGIGIQGLENIFSNPKAWDMLAFQNIWEDGMYGTECGYFVPCYRANSSFMDADGNVDIAGAIKADEVERLKKKKSGKPKDLDGRKAEYPQTPAEALQRMSNNGFNIALIDDQIKKIRNTPGIQSMIRHGKMVRREAGLEFDVQPKHIARPIETWPHRQSDDLTGCVSMIERPWMDAKGNIPPNMYKITFDPYAKEESEDLTSLWSIKVWKMDNIHNPSFANLPVAWYAGRPTRYEDNHDILFMLADYFNATIQGEIAGGGQSVVTYAKLHRRLHQLCHEPEMMHNKEIASKSAGVSYLMNMPTGRKALGITYLEDWHVDPRGVDERGNIILNIHRIYDIAFLYELRGWYQKANCDRISDALIFMYEMKENYARIIKERRKARQFYTKERVFFGGGGAQQEQGYTTAY